MYMSEEATHARAVPTGIIALSGLCASGVGLFCLAVVVVTVDTDISMF